MFFITILIFTNCNERETKKQNEKFTGIWTGYSIDLKTGEKMWPMTMEFTNEGRVNYIFNPKTNMQYGFSQSYRVEGNYLYLKDLEREKKVKFQIDENKLIIIIDKIVNEFVKQEVEIRNK